MLLCEVEIGDTFAIGFEPRTIGLIVREALKRDQSERDVVGALVRHPVAEQIAAALGNDREPALRVGLEKMAPERSSW